MARHHAPPTSSAPIKRILVIEDTAPMRHNLALILELDGFEVAAAENGRAGLESVRTRRPDLILCDIMMPEMDGHAVVRALRADPGTATIPFIILHPARVRQTE